MPPPHTTFPPSDSGLASVSSHDDLRRWRLAGYGIMAASTAFSCCLYWNIGAWIVAML